MTKKFNKVFHILIGSIVYDLNTLAMEAYFKLWGNKQRREKLDQIKGALGLIPLSNSIWAKSSQ